MFEIDKYILYIFLFIFNKIIINYYKNIEKNMKFIKNYLRSEKIKNRIEKIDFRVFNVF